MTGETPQVAAPNYQIFVASLGAPVTLVSVISLRMKKMRCFAICCSFLLISFSTSVRAATAQADMEQKYGYGNGTGTSTKFSAYSVETAPLARGPNDFTFYKIQYSFQNPPFGNPTTVTPVPVDNGAEIKIPTGLFGWGRWTQILPHRLPGKPAQA
jgi:hypothetical protein